MHFDVQKIKVPFLTAIVLTVALLLSACASLVPDTGLSSQEILATQEALIFSAVKATATTGAMQTQIAQLQTQVANPQTPVANPPTPVPQVPTATQVPSTATAVPTATQVPPTPTASIPCNNASFVNDVTIPDGSILMPGTYFSKTWRLKNTGSCTWNTSYDLVFVGGDLLGASAEQPLPGSVAPGQVVDLTAAMTAPGRDGFYRGYWRLRDGSGTLFGLGSKSASFYVDIQVQTPRSDSPMDFAASYCSAAWSSGAGRLPCQGPADDSRGSVQWIARPVLEDGYVDDEPALRMQPQKINDGVIRGKYPAIRIENGHVFTAVIGCSHKSSGCDVKFQVDFQIGDGPIQTLATWHEVYDEMYRPVAVDLSDLRGNDVNLILTVLANGSSANDSALWLAPRVAKRIVPTPRVE